MADYDSPWKEAMDRYFEAFLAFFFPLIYALIDWQRDYEPLDSELRKLAPDAAIGKRHIDKLVKAYRVETRDMRLLHAELQCQPEEGFERRMHVYNYRIEDTYNHPVLTMVIAGDPKPEWRPSEYVHEEAGCKRTLKFEMVKLLDYAGRLEELDRGPLFGVLVAAHLVAMLHGKDVPTQKAWKLRLLRGLYERQELDGEDIRQWSRYIDWLLILPPEEAREVWQAIQRLEEEKQMPFVTSFQQIGEQIGFEKGYDKGFDQGVKESEEKRQAIRRALLLALEQLLDVRFGPDGLALMDSIRKQEDEAALERLTLAVKTATLDEIRALLA